VFVKSSITLYGIPTLTVPVAQQMIASLLNVQLGSVVITSLAGTPVRRSLLAINTLIGYEILATSAAQVSTLTTAIPAITTAQVAALVPGTTSITNGPVTIASTSTTSSASPMTLDNNKAMTIATIVIIALLFGLFLISALVQCIVSRRAAPAPPYGEFKPALQSGAMKRRYLVGSTFLRGAN